MDYKICVFGGEWKEFALDQEELGKILRKIVIEYEIQEFYSLGVSVMDKAMEEGVRTLKKEMPQLVLTYVIGKKNINPLCLEEYDRVLVASTEREDREGIYHWLIDCSHYCLLSSESLLGGHLKTYAGKKCLLDFATMEG